MRKFGQGAVLIMGGLVGVLGVLAQIEQRDFLLGAFLLLMTIAAFSLAFWLFRKGKQELDSSRDT